MEHSLPDTLCYCKKVILTNLTAVLEFLQVAIDISGDGRIPQPPYSPNVETGILNITIFLFSYVTGLNLTISNGTSYGWLNDRSEAPEFNCNSSTSQGFQNAGCEEIMAQESGSTVKHVNWAWPDCFVSDDGEKDSGSSSARGSYNVGSWPLLSPNLVN
ncbi:uncharacterized protein A1O5_09359 [Cladophialophora psammophila CBS 110553]|uniref:Uncharacterized protein n=1 Tax=Cladophialophora psammophila CBS 110553 TaxID=1182543 RepID=W9WRT4_9EURO|nr:uncharacterized protein A1O5_09359 [Cladophialophora psammophila CBS 110553]EXJ67346.1 hypothetical protein A1O5_09359 [Cladophialophora psammophila CBS 110553]